MTSISFNNVGCNFKKCNNQSLYFCNEHNLHLCEGHKDIYEDQLDIKCITNDEYNSVSKFFNYNQLFKSSFTNEEFDQYNSNMDIKNKFIYLNDDNQLSYGEKYHNCGLDSSDPFISVSFIGNSGSGKSSTIGQLCIEDNQLILNHPIPSTTNSNSTSSDINSFIGKTNDGKFKYILFDTEGLGGSLNPSTLNYENKKEKKLNEKRFKIVQKVYPMLLYTISDVIVYTFSGGPSEKKTIIESLYSISMVSSSITNKTSKPHLIILFNRQSNSNLFKDSNSATDDFFKSCSNKLKGLLIQTYRSIKVIYLPNLNETNSFSTFKTQLELLKQLVSDGINNSLEYKKSNNLMVTRDHGISMVTKLIEKFNMDPNSNLDLERIGITCINNDRSNLAQRISFDSQYSNSSFSIGSSGGAGGYSNSPICSSTYIPLSFQNNLITNKIIERLSSNYLVYFNVCYNKFINNNGSKHISYDHSMQMLKYALYSSFKKLMLRNKVNDTHSNEFFGQFVPVLKKLSDELIEYIPCGKKINNKYDCINSKNSHDLHQSNETYEVKKGYFKEKIQKPYEENGPYENNSSPENFEQYLLNILQDTSTINEEIALDVKNCFQICIGCLLEPPLLQFNCEHVLCLKCCIENNDKCSINGCDGIFSNRKDVDFIPSMGCRILTLDGGGIRGIIECVALQLIKEELFGIEIHQLFDLIVGTSTGGIIALATVATKYSPKDIIKTFEDMAVNVFNSNIVKHVLSLVNITSKYSRDNLKNCLLNTFEQKRLSETFERTRVAVTSVTEEERKECLFINYFKGVSSEDQHRYIIDASCVEAALATSAAPTYFPPFKFKGHYYHDGGLRNNNPCKVALNEYNSLWPQKKIDVFISLGTGSFKKKSIINSNILKLANMIIDILTECEKSWEDINKKVYMNDNEKIIINQDINSFRINPLIEKEIGLDQCDIETLKILKSSYNSTHSSLLQKPIKKLLSSLFYISDLEWNENTKVLAGNIKFRLKVMPSELVRQLNSNKHFFHYYKNGKLEDISKTSDIPINGKFRMIPFQIQNPTLPDNIDILCSLEIKNGYAKMTSISGCPFSLLECFKLYNIKLIK